MANWDCRGASADVGCPDVAFGVVFVPHLALRPVTFRRFVMLNPSAVNANKRQLPKLSLRDNRRPRVKKLGTVREGVVSHADLE